MPHSWLGTRRRTFAIAAGFAAALTAAACLGLTYSPVFGAREIRVRGNVVLGTHRVVAVAGLELGTNVVHLDTGAIEERLLRDPWVAVASVRRDLPGTIVIRIREREPMARLLDGPVVAGDGTVLPGAPAGRLPEIRPTYGELDLRAAAGAAEALEAMSPTVRGRVFAVVVQPDGTLVVELRSGIVVRYGAPLDLVEKGASLRAVLRWAQGEGELTAVDVSVPSAPSATLRGSTSSADRGPSSAALLVVTGIDNRTVPSRRRPA